MLLRNPVILAALLVTGCEPAPRADTRADSLALAASGGVRTDSGAVPMRIAREPQHRVAFDPGWAENMRIGEDAAPSAFPTPPMPPMPAMPPVPPADDTDDQSIDEARHDAEMLREEAAAAAVAASEAEAAAAVAEARVEAMLGREGTRLAAHRRARERRMRIRY